MTTCTWEDVPHLDEEAKREVLSGQPPHLRDARSKGIPTVGQGNVYQTQLDDILFDPRKVQIQPHWRHVFGLDDGWNVSAVMFGAWDKDKDIVYLYHEIYLRRANLPTVSSGIRKMGGGMEGWMRGVGDAARSNRDGEQIIRQYRKDEKINVRLPPTKEVEAGVMAVNTRLETGRLRVSKHCTNWQTEYMGYHYDDHGHIVKNNDHAMDATRYLIYGGLKYARQRPSGGRKSDQITPIRFSNW